MNKLGLVVTQRIAYKVTTKRKHSDAVADNLLNQNFNPVAPNQIWAGDVDKGYKQGTYIKIWQGKEDNEHLVEVLASLDINADNYSTLIYEGLSERYPS